jgi:hypothetical protein
VTVAFRATPVKARLNENVEVTVKSSKQLTIPKDTLLSSNQRSEQRQLFDQMLKEKEQ